MKKNILLLFLSLMQIPIFSVNFGFDVKQENFLCEKTQYTPAYYDSYNINFFTQIDFSFKNLFCSVYPNLCLKDENIYLNFYKFKFNYYHNFFVVSLDKDIFYYGKGNITNLSLPQSLNIENKEKNVWFTKIDFFILGQTLTAGLLIDNNIDYYKKVEYLNPFIIYNFNNNFLNIIYTCDYLINENLSLKNALEIELLSKNDLSIYSSARFITNFNDKNEIKANFGISKAFIFDKFIFSPLTEIEYEFNNKDLGILLNLHNDIYELVSIDTGLFYSNDDILNLRAEINFYIKNFIINLLYQSSDLIEKDNKEKGFFSVGVKCEI